MAVIVTAARSHQQAAMVRTGVLRFDGCSRFLNKKKQIFLRSNITNFMVIYICKIFK